MPQEGDIYATYPIRLLIIGIQLQESFKGAKTQHRMKCLICKHKWVATPIAKLQSFRKYGVNGCPMCNLDRQNAEKKQIRANNIQKLKDRGIEVLSDWDGTIGKGKESAPMEVTVRNVNCNHTFTCSSKNLLSRGTICTVCGIEERTTHINKWSKANSDEWKKTATEWKIYKSKVQSLSRFAYRANKSTINPTDLPTGLAGTEGAYHVDHIVPIRYCYDNDIPEEACAHYTNLQMLGWRDNVGSRDKLKPGMLIPQILEQYTTKEDHQPQN
jgi:hypothetical protein